jgi:hypothetical protein
MGFDYGRGIRNRQWSHHQGERGRGRKKERMKKRVGGVLAGQSRRLDWCDCVASYQTA